MVYVAHHLVDGKRIPRAPLGHRTASTAERCGRTGLLESTAIRLGEKGTPLWPNASVLLSSSIALSMEKSSMTGYTGDLLDRHALALTVSPIPGRDAVLVQHSARSQKRTTEARIYIWRLIGRHSMKSVLALLALVMVTVLAACGSEGLSNSQFPCNILSVSGMCAVPSPTPIR